MLVALQGNHIQMSPLVKIYTHCFINNQFLGVQNGKKLDKYNITFSLYHSLAGSETISLLFEEQSQTVVKKLFLSCHVTIYDLLLDMEIIF